MGPSVGPQAASLYPQAPPSHTVGLPELLSLQSQRKYLAILALSLPFLVSFLPAPI